MSNSTNGNDVPAEATAYRWRYGREAGPDAPKVDDATMCQCGYRRLVHSAKGELLIAGYNSCRGFTPKVEEATE